MFWVLSHLRDDVAHGVAQQVDVLPAAAGARHAVEEDGLFPAPRKLLNL